MKMAIRLAGVVLLAMAIGVVGLFVVAPRTLGGTSDTGMLSGTFPSEINAPGQVIHAVMVTERGDVDRRFSEELWIDTSNGSFLVIESQDSNVVRLAACDGSRFKTYDTSNRRAADLSASLVMALEPEVITPRSEALEALRQWSADAAARSGNPGMPMESNDRSALLYKGIAAGSRAPDAHAPRLELILDSATGLPLQVVLRGSGGESLSRTVYDYELSSPPQGGFDVEFPEGYQVQTDQDMDPRSAERLPIGEIARSVDHPVYWAGESLGARPMTASRVSKSGIVTLEYGAHSQHHGGSARSSLVKIYQYVASGLDSRTLSNIEAQLTDPKKVRGRNGTYLLYDVALNGMPVLRVEIDDVVILIADVEDGNTEVMVSAADALVEASD